MPSTAISIDSLTRSIDYNVVVTRRMLEALCQDIFVFIREVLARSLKQARLSSSIDTIDEVILVGGSSTIPRVQEEVKSFFGKVPEELGDNARELVALGASLLSAPHHQSPLESAGVLTSEVLDSTIG